MIQLFSCTYICSYHILWLVALWCSALPAPNQLIPPEDLQIIGSRVWVIKEILDRRGHTDPVPDQGRRGEGRQVGLAVYFIRTLSRDGQVRREGRASMYSCARARVLCSQVSVTKCQSSHLSPAMFSPNCLYINIYTYTINWLLFFMSYSRSFHNSVNAAFFWYRFQANWTKTQGDDMKRLSWSEFPVLM